MRPRVLITCLFDSNSNGHTKPKGLLPAPNLNPIQTTCNIYLKKLSKSCAMDFV